MRKSTINGFHRNEGNLFAFGIMPTTLQVKCMFNLFFLFLVADDFQTLAVSSGNPTFDVENRITNPIKTSPTRDEGFSKKNIWPFVLYRLRRYWPFEGPETFNFELFKSYVIPSRKSSTSSLFQAGLDRQDKTQFYFFSPF